MIKLYRCVSVIEGLSFVVLLFIAIPFKYLLHIPEPVKYLGWVHGFLFILFVTILLITGYTFKWKPSRIGAYFLYSLVPFVPFIIDRKLKIEYK